MADAVQPFACQCTCPWDWSYALVRSFTFSGPVSTELCKFNAVGFPKSLLFLENCVLYGCIKVGNVGASLSADLSTGRRELLELGLLQGWFVIL